MQPGRLAHYLVQHFRPDYIHLLNIAWFPGFTEEGLLFSTAWESFRLMNCVWQKEGGTNNTLGNTCMYNYHQYIILMWMVSVCLCATNVTSPNTLGMKLQGLLRYKHVDFLGMANHIAMADMVIFIAP